MAVRDRRSIAEQLKNLAEAGEETVFDTLRELGQEAEQYRVYDGMRRLHNNSKIVFSPTIASLLRHSMEHWTT